MLSLVREWLGRDGIIFCGHNVLFWLLLLKALGLVKCRIVSNLWAREPLNFASSHSAIVALTKAGVEQANKLAPRIRAVSMGWGADLSIFPKSPYRPEVFLSCGIAGRDFETMTRAAERCHHQLEVILPGLVDGVNWPENVTIIDSGKGLNFQNKRLSYQELLERHHARSAAALIITIPDEAQYHALGFTEIIEVLAMGRPVIMTRTGAPPTEIDVERAGCGIFVPPRDADALAEAIDYIGDNPDVGAEMGRKARALAEEYYNIDRYAADLHALFAGL